MGFSSALGLHGQGRGSPWAECLGEGKHIPKGSRIFIARFGCYYPVLLHLGGSERSHEPSQPWENTLGIGTC